MFKRYNNHQMMNARKGGALGIIFVAIIIFAIIVILMFKGMQSLATLSTDEVNTANYNMQQHTGAVNTCLNNYSQEYGQGAYSECLNKDGKTYYCPVRVKTGVCKLKQITLHQGQGGQNGW